MPYDSFGSCDTLHRPKLQGGLVELSEPELDLSGEDVYER